VTVWDVTRPENPSRVLNMIQPGGCRTLLALDLGPSGLLVFGGEDGQIVVWDLSRPGQLRRVGQVELAPRPVPRGGPTGAFAARFSPDGRFLVAGGRPKSGAPARIWRLDDPQGPHPVAKLQPHRTSPFGMEPSTCHDLAFSSRRSLLVTASEYDYWIYTGEYDYYHPQLHDSAVVIWDVHNLSRPRGLVTLGERGGDTPLNWRNRPNRATPTTLAGHADTARVVSISPDGTRLATGADDRQVLVWDITNPADPTCLATLACSGPVQALTFTPDSCLLASAADDNDDRVMIWDVPRTVANRIPGS
jgi:WD40 repeat protein